MAVLQALLALVSRSAGKILNAIFGWAVHALFGKTAARDSTFLSALVAAAAVWPLLIAGIVAPKIAAYVLAFVPLPHSVPSWIVRLIWTALALIVPVALGLTLAARQPHRLRADPVWKRVLRGFPLTLALATAFLVMFVTIPVIRLIALLRREKSADIPLVTDNEAYHQTAARMVEALNAHGFQLRAAEPGWWTKAPTRILSVLGGRAFAGFVPERIEHYVGKDMVLSFYPSGALARGKGQRVTWAHGLIVETAAHSEGLQTFAPKAQETERRLRDIWRALDVDAPKARSGYLLSSVETLARELGTLDVPYDDWQAIYRQLLQLDRAVRGQRQLLDAVTSTHTPKPSARDASKLTPSFPGYRPPFRERPPGPGFATTLNGPPRLSVDRTIRPASHTTTMTNLKGQS